MKALLDNKRQVVVYLPYKTSGNVFSFFLQKRDEHAPVHANTYSLFGGGVETGESLEQALKREVTEELGIQPIAPTYLTHCSTGYGDFFVFIENVEDDFGSKVTIGEGLGGDFMPSDEALTRSDISPIARVAVEGTTWYLASQNTGH